MLFNQPTEETGADMRVGSTDVSPVRQLIITHSKLLSLLLVHGPMMRIDMAKWLGITTSAVTYRTAELIAAGLIREVGEVSTRTGPGRKSQLVDLASDGAYAIGIHRTGTEIEVGLVGLKGKTVAVRRLAMPPQSAYRAEQAMADVANTMASILADYAISPDRLVGIGMATIGAADTLKGVEYRYEVGDEQITPIPMTTAAALAQYVAVPVEMANKARAMASGERWFGCKLRSFLLVHAHHGVGSAVILGGYLHTGQGHAGTIGHIKVDDNGPVCSCGEHGCLEAFVNRHALLAQINEFSDLTDLYDAAEVARAGDQRIVKVLCHAAGLIAQACAPVVDALEPDALVLAGPIAVVPQAIEEIKSYLDTHTFVGRLHRIRVLPDSFGREAGVVGAASLAFGSLLQPRATLLQNGRRPDWPPVSIDQNERGVAK